MIYVLSFRYFGFVRRGCGPIFATKNVCKNLIANVQLEAMGQEQVVQKQKTVGVKKSAKISLTARFIVSNLSSWVFTKTV